MYNSRDANLVAVHAERLLCGVLLTSLFLYISVPALYVPGEDNDRSIRAVLNHCAIVDCRSGTDYVLTYGPASWLANRASDPALTWYQLAFWIITAAIVCAGLAQVRWFPMGRAATWVIGTGLFATGVEPLYQLYFPDAFFLTSLALIASIVLSVPLLPRTVPGKYTYYLFTAISLLWISTIGFTKGTLLFPSLVVMILWAIRIDKRPSRLETIFRLIGVSCAVLLVWKISGQYISDLPRYVYAMFRLTTGYPAGVTFLAGGIWTPTVSLAFALLALIVVCYGMAFQFVPKPRLGTTRIGALLVISLCTFIAWKQTAEAGGRVLIQMLPALTGLLVLTIGYPRTFKAKLTAIVLLALSLPAIATYTWSPGGKWDWRGVAEIKKEIVVESFSFWTSAETRRLVSSRLFQDRLARNSRLKLPRIRQLIDRGSVDLYGESQTVMLTNEFHWTPRPVYQSMAAFSPFLAELNRKRIADSPPEFIIVTQAGYRNYPTMDDWPWTQLFVHNYRFLAVDGERDLYEYTRRANLLPIRPAATLISVSAFSWNAKIDVPQLAHSYTEMRLPIRLSRTGRLRALVFQHPAVHIDIELKDGRKKTHTLNIATAGTGFMISPYLESSNDIRNVIGSVEGFNEVQSLTIRTENWQFLFIPPNHVEFYAVAPHRDQ